MGATRENTTLDDLAGVIGFTATVRLSVWWGGRNLYVASEPDDSMRLVKLIGLPAAKRLAEAWGNEHIAVPTLWAYEEDQRNKMVLSQLEDGKTPKAIASSFGMSERRVQQIRRTLEETGLLQVVLGKNGPAA